MNISITIRQANISDINQLLEFLISLSDESKNRFAPHLFSKEALLHLFNQSHLYKVYIGINSELNKIIAYTIVKVGWVDHEIPRLTSYGFLENKKKDCTYAPIVADEWQSKGIGSRMFKFVVDDLRKICKTERIILWGGVRSNNLKAVSFYKKYGFSILGYYEYNGQNIDMILQL